MNCKECYPKYCKNADCRTARKIEATPGNCNPCRLETSDILNGNTCSDVTCPKGEAIVIFKRQLSKTRGIKPTNNVF